MRTSLFLQSGWLAPQDGFSLRSSTSGAAVLCRLVSRARLLGCVLLFWLIAVGHLAAALNATFQVTSAWSTGYNANLVIANGGTEPVGNWSASLQSADPVTTAWNATLAGGSGSYTLTPASWDGTISAGSPVTVGFTFTGSNPAPLSNLLVNGQSVTITVSSPAVTPTPTPSASVTPTPSPGTPGVPSLSIQKDWTTGVGFTASWSSYSGVAATSWQLLEDNVVYAQGTSSTPTSGGQTTPSPSRIDRTAPMIIKSWSPTPPVRARATP